MNGGSHTNFDARAFSTGAVGGAGLVAGALVAGLRNAAAVRRDRNAAVAIGVRNDIINHLQRRVDNQRAEIARRDETISNQALYIQELKVRLQMSQYLRERGR